MTVTAHAGQENSYDRVRDCATQAGVLRQVEFDAAASVWERTLRARGDSPSWSNPTPYVLTGAPGEPETAALRWDWDTRKVDWFARWCERALAGRFGVTWQVRGDNLTSGGDAEYLLLTRDGQTERCDWRYLNQHRWAGAFCAIAERLLRPVGIAALELETGWFDVVICFCAATSADELSGWFAEAE